MHPGYCITLKRQSEAKRMPGGNTAFCSQGATEIILSRAE